MTCTDAQWTPEEEYQFIQHILDWIGNDAIAAAIRDSLGIYQDIDHTIDLLSSNEDLINALKNQKGSFDIKNKKEFEIIKNRMIAIPAFIRSINEQHLYSIGRGTFSLPYLKHDFNTLIKYIPSEDNSSIPEPSCEIIRCATFRSQDALWDTLFDDVCQQQCMDIGLSDGSFPSIIGSDRESSNNEQINIDVADGEKDNNTLVVDSGIPFTSGLGSISNVSIDTAPINDDDLLVHTCTGGQMSGDNGMDDLAHRDNSGDIISSVVDTASAHTTGSAVKITTADGIMNRTGDADLVYLYKNTRMLNKKIRRALSRHLTGTSRNYEGAICIADPYVTIIQKYARCHLSKLKIVKMRGRRHQRQITFVRRTECTPRIADKDWGATAIAILILRRRYVRDSATIPHSVVHDWELIDILVRAFSDKIGQAIRYGTSNDTPSSTSNQHHVECRRRYSSTFTCFGHVPEPDPFSTQPYLPSTYSVHPMMPSFLTCYDLYTFSTEDGGIIIDGRGAGTADNRIQNGWGVDAIISIMPSVSDSNYNHTDTVAVSALPSCGEYDSTHDTRRLDRDLGSLDRYLGAFTTSSFCQFDCRNSKRATAVEDAELIAIYTIIDAHYTLDSSIIIEKGITNTGTSNNGDAPYQGIDIALRQHFEAHSVLYSSHQPSHATDVYCVLLQSVRSLHFVPFPSTSLRRVLYTCLRLSAYGSSITLFPPTCVVGLIFVIEDGEILEITKKACKYILEITKTHMLSMTYDYVIESEGDRIDIGRGISIGNVEFAYSRYAFVTHPLATCTIGKGGCFCNMVVFWVVCPEFEIGDIELLNQDTVMRANGELHHTSLIFPIHPMHLDSVHIWIGDKGLSIHNGSSTKLWHKIRFLVSTVVMEPNFYTSLANTEAEEIGLIYTYNTTHVDDDDSTHFGRTDCFITIGASEYGEPSFNTSNFDNNYDYYANNSASNVALTSGINDALNDLVTINTYGGELLTSSTITQHDADDAPEHGEPSELKTNNSTTCHKSASCAHTYRDHQYCLDGSLSYSTTCNNNSDRDPLDMLLHGSSDIIILIGNATDWHDDSVRLELECVGLPFAVHISLVLVHIDKRSLCSTPEWNSNVKTGPTSKCDNNYVGGIICGHNHNIVTRLRSMVTKYIMNSTLLPVPINIGSRVHTSNYFGYAIQQGITSDNVRRYSITPSAISTLVGNCTHPNMGSIDIVIVTTRCAFVGLHPLHGNTWPYSLNIVQRMTINTAPIDGLEKDLPCSTLNWDGNTVIVYTAAFDCTIINAINYLSARSMTYSTSSDVHKSISAYAPRGTAYIVLAYMSGINTAISCHLQRDNAITLSTGSVYRYGISSYTTYISLGYSNIGNNHNDTGMILVDGTLVSSTIHPLNKMCHSVHNNLNSSTMDTNDNDLGNVDSFSMSRTNARVSDYITSNHESMSDCKLDCCNTDNTHNGTGSEEPLACAVTYDETQMYITYNNEMNTLWMRASNGCMNCVMIRECERSSSRCDIVIIQYDTIMQSWKLDNEMGFTLDNSMHVNEMKPCYSFQLTILYMHVVQTDMEYVMKRGKLTLDLCLGTRILISWMTKANRRGVTCTGEYGFVWYLVASVLVKSSEIGVRSPFLKSPG